MILQDLSKDLKLLMVGPHIEIFAEMYLVLHVLVQDRMSSALPFYYASSISQRCRATQGFIMFLLLVKFNT